MMDNPIYNSRSNYPVTEEVSPVFKVSVCGDDHRPRFVPPANDLKEIFQTVLRHFFEAQLIKYQQVRL